MQDLIIDEIDEVTAKIDALDEIRRRLEASLVMIQEEELELDDERASACSWNLDELLLMAASSSRRRQGAHGAAAARRTADRGGQRVGHIAGRNAELAPAQGPGVPSFRA